MTIKRNWFHILLALADQDRHGSDIVRDVLDQTGGVLTLWPATLYGALDAMMSEGLISELAESMHPLGESERRRYFRIAAKGRGALASEAKRLEELAASARHRLETPRTSAR